jgi:hypothetical protein
MAKRVISTIAKKELEIVIKTSTSWKEAMCYFRDNHGYKNIRDNSTLKKRCEKDNISTCHFYGGVRKVKLEKSNKKHSAYHLKTRLIKEGLLENKCSICNLEPKWMGKPIALQMDHINGDRYDNTLTNLRILCPNCHSQTDTFAGKNIGRKKSSEEESEVEESEEESEESEEEEEESEEEPIYLCVDCNVEIQKDRFRCSACNDIHKKYGKRKVSDRPSLEQLETDLKELKYYVKVGEKYGVSDNCIRKWIKQYKSENLKSKPA